MTEGEKHISELLGCEVWKRELSYCWPSKCGWPLRSTLRDGTEIWWVGEKVNRICIPRQGNIEDWLNYDLRDGSLIQFTQVDGQKEGEQTITDVKGARKRKLQIKNGMRKK